MTFEDAWKEVLLHSPMVSPFLARKWVQWAYARAGELRPWSNLRVETTIQTAAEKTGTVGVTNGSTAVTGGTLAFGAGDLYRQFRIGTSPIYTVAAVSAPDATLDRAYTGETEAAATASVLDAYILCPADFGRWGSILDIDNCWRLHHYITEDWLNRVDPRREHAESPRAVVSRMAATIAAIRGRLTYELWPYKTTAQQFPAVYFKVPETLADTDTIPGHFSRRSDVLVTGALSQCARWPGVEGRKNPYFNLQLSKDLKEDFDKECGLLEVKDEDIYPTWTPRSEYRWAPMIGDANWLREHDAPAVNYY